MKSIRYIIMLCWLTPPLVSFTQDSYNDSIKSFIKDYIAKHEVVKGDNKKYLSFYPVNEEYRIVADFEKVQNAKWFTMQSSGNRKQTYRIYGIIRFTIHDTALKLNIYQSQDLLPSAEYKDYLFLPFSDLTSGEETYGSGRYIDLRFDDIKENKVTVDFNKAYNPYCAYVSGEYSCPIPPKENALGIAILAGEKNYQKKH